MKNTIDSTKIVFFLLYWIIIYLVYYLDFNKRTVFLPLYIAFVRYVK